VEITRQYDFMSDFPLYPLNFIADANAVLGFVYVHLYPFDVSLAPDPSTSPPIKSQHGDTTYYFFETQDLPLFDPLRTVGVPEPVIDVVEPVAKVAVELGYDRSIPPGEPTPARLIPPINPVKVTSDLVDAVGEGANNATKLTPKSLTDGFKFTPPKLGSATGDNQTGGPLAKVGANIGDSLQQVGQNVEKTIKKATDSVTKGFSGFNGHKVDSQG
jgi:hypothetical protein